MEATERRPGALSRAAGAVLAVERDSWQDYEMDGSGELGGRIYAHHERTKLAAVQREGFATAAAWNAKVREALVGADGTMSYRTYDLLRSLEIDEEAIA